MLVMKKYEDVPGCCNEISPIRTQLKPYLTKTVVEYSYNQKKKKQNRYIKQRAHINWKYNLMFDYVQ